MFDTIVLPTDGSEYAEAAADAGIELAAAHDAAVHVVSVADTGPLGEIRLPGDAASAEDAMREQAGAYVDAVADRAADAGLAVTRAVRTGTPGHELLAYADEVDADLVVMGTRGRGGIQRMAMGSVTDHVVRFGDIPVLVANSGSTAD